MTVCRRSGPDFHSCSACCFCALQTDAPSNLFILGWAMGVTCCHCMAPIQRHPMYKLSVSMITLMSVCVCWHAHEHMLAGLCVCVSLLREIHYEFSLPVKYLICVCLVTSGLYPKMTALQSINLIRHLLWPRIGFPNFPLIELSPPVIRILLSGWALQINACLRTRRGQEQDEIWTPAWVVWLSPIRLFYTAEHLSAIWQPITTCAALRRILKKYEKNQLLCEEGHHLCLSAHIQPEIHVDLL